jgi:hypothetical protein
VPGRERGRLVEEEEGGVAAPRRNGCAVPAAELQPARDPAAAGVVADDAPACVVQAATVSVDEPTLGRGDDFAQGSHTVRERHEDIVEGEGSRGENLVRRYGR